MVRITAKNCIIEFSHFQAMPEITIKESKHRMTICRFGKGGVRKYYKPIALADLLIKVFNPHFRLHPLLFLALNRVKLILNQLASNMALLIFSFIRSTLFIRMNTFAFIYWPNL